MTKINETVREMHPIRYTTAQAAAQVGKSSDTLRRWRDEGRVKPSDSRAFGKVVVPLYTPEDIARLRATAKTIRRGAPRQSA